MFGMNFSKKESEENSNDILIIDDDEKSNNELDIKKEYFNKWANATICKNDIENCQLNCKENCKFNCGEEYYNDCVENCPNDEENNNDVVVHDKLNEDDDDENVVDKLYVISIDGIPYYYENDLTSARSKMWAIANNLLKNDSQHNETTNYIFTNSLNKVSLISPYNFFGLNYHHTICELQIDYVTRYNK